MTPQHAKVKIVLEPKHLAVHKHFVMDLLVLQVHILAMKLYAQAIGENASRQIQHVQHTARTIVLHTAQH
jgi:hypothetical protein